MEGNIKEKRMPVYMPPGMASIPALGLFPEFQFYSLPGKVNNWVIFWTFLQDYLKDSPSALCLYPWCLGGNLAEPRKAYKSPLGELAKSPTVSYSPEWFTLPFIFGSSVGQCGWWVEILTINWLWSEVAADWSQCVLGLVTATVGQSWPEARGGPRVVRAGPGDSHCGTELARSTGRASGCVCRPDPSRWMGADKSDLCSMEWSDDMKTVTSLRLKHQAQKRHL